METPVHKDMNHQPPEWVKADSCYFITVCMEQRKLNQLCLPVAGSQVLKSIQHYHESGRWYCHVAVLMPDHGHLLINFADIALLARLIGDWKRWLAKHAGLVWQENFFEHRLRSGESIVSKSRYILQNPVRAGLVGKCEEWPYLWMPQYENDKQRPLTHQ